MIYKKQTVLGSLWRQQAWVFVLMILTGLGLGAFRIVTLQSASDFVANGKEVNGVITHLQDYHGTGKNTKTYTVSYHFATPYDPNTNGRQRVSASFYDGLTDGGPINVWYLPSDPATNVVDLDKLSNGFGLTMLAALGLILIGGAGGAIAVQRTRANLHLRDAGDVVPATVTAHVSEGAKDVKGYMQWRDATNGEGRSLSTNMADLPPVGTTISTYVDPARKRKPVWEGDIGSR